MIRAGKYADIIRLTELIVEMHEKSVYAEKTILKKDLFKNICSSALSQKGRRACLYVSENNEGVIEGFIVGMVDRIYGVTKELYATDLFFYMSERSSSKDAIGLILLFRRWAESVKGVIEIRLGITGAIGGWKRLQKIYERLGYKQDGVMMVKEI